MKRMQSTFIILVVLALTLVGCKNGEQLQLDVQQALSKHSEMNNYRFSGEAELHLESPSEGWSGNPLTSGLLSMITNGHLSWEGVASVEPVRMELNLKLTPQGSGAAIDMPMLIQDNKMYIHIPVINDAEQFYEIDLNELSKLSGSENTLSSERITDVAQLFSSIFNEIISAVQPKFFEEDKKESDSELRSIHITLDQKQVEEAINIWYSALPSIIERLGDFGYIQPETQQKWTEKLSKTNHDDAIKNSDFITLNDPLSLHMLIDGDGFMRESNFVMNVTSVDKNQVTKSWSVDVTNRYDDINQNPPFTKQIPTNIKPFTDILNQLSGLANP